MNKTLFISGRDRGVSPVIGVILMVAITVILAAVIGTFVLGLGDEIGGSDTTASLSFDYDDSGDDGILTITHRGGDSLENATLAGAGVDNVEDLEGDEDANNFNLSPGESVEFEEDDDPDAEFNPGQTVSVVVGDDVVASFEIPE